MIRKTKETGFLSMRSNLAKWVETVPPTHQVGTAHALLRLHSLQRTTTRELQELRRRRCSSRSGRSVAVLERMPTSPMRYHGSKVADMAPSPRLGQHNEEVYGEFLGLSAAEVAALKAEGVI